MQTSTESHHPAILRGLRPASPSANITMRNLNPQKAELRPDIRFASHLVAQLVVPTFVLDTTGTVILWNTACEALTGLPARKVIGTRDHWRAFYGAERPCLADLMIEDRLGEVDYYYPVRRPSHDLAQGVHAENWCEMPLRGEALYLEFDVGPIFDAEGRLVGVVETLRDISDRKRADDALSLYAKVFEHSGAATLISDADNRIIAVNQALELDTGYTQKELIGKDPSMLSANKTSPETYRLMWSALKDKDSGYWQGELWDLRKDGSTYPKWAAITAIFDAKGDITNYIASYTDISERKAAEARIARLAHHDALTGLFNRYSLESRLAQALLAARREKRQMAVIFIDLDRFKAINDTLGHHVGDLLLIEVAQRLSTCVRESDIVARLGGDEFVVALTSLANDLDAAHIAKKIISTLGSPCEIEGKQLHTTPSVGISLFPDNGEDVNVLMKNADTAMYHAKEKGRNNFQFFSPAMTAAATERLEIERDLRTALKKQEFELHYQPQVCASKGLIRGVEALIRWSHPERGLIPPLKFIPVAEDTGVIEEIGAWVLEDACRQMAEWRRAGFDLKHVAVNLSAHQLRSPDLVGMVQGAIARFGLAPGQLELEITESVAMEDPERAIGQLRALRESGVELAIDDFGTGYSSLAYLKLLPIHTLKLDRAFVRDIETDENDAAISAATLALAKNLGLRVVAEGVETEAQRDFLSSHGCNLLQGYLFGKPEPADALTARWQSSTAMPQIGRQTSGDGLAA
jgi:diguanylate cyclase (GGDEF)-like protein/PAS domain S-box-containing protein